MILSVIYPLFIPFLIVMCLYLVYCLIVGEYMGVYKNRIEILYEFIIVLSVTIVLSSIFYYELQQANKNIARDQKIDKILLEN